MMLKLARLTEEDIEVASVTISSFKSSVSCGVLITEEHDEEASVTAPLPNSPDSGDVPFSVKLIQLTPEFVREASKTPL